MSSGLRPAEERQSSTGPSSGSPDDFIWVGSALAGRRPFLGTREAPPAANTSFQVAVHVAASHRRNALALFRPTSLPFCFDLDAGGDGDALTLSGREDTDALGALVPAASRPLGPRC